MVDDDFDNRKLLVEILRCHAECDVAANGTEACRAFGLSQEEQKPYDMILLDVAMPDMDGIEVLARIREREEQQGVLLGNGVPIIMVTAHPIAFTKSFIQGCDDFIIKPVDAVKLIEKIKTRLEGK